MSVFNFKNLEDSYQVRVTHTFSDDILHSYSAVIDVTAERTATNEYRFILLGRRDVMVDEEEPERISDIIMQELGDCLYPISLSVSSDKEIRKIENMSRIKARRQAKSAELLKRYAGTEVEPYLRASEYNLSDERQFLKALCRDAFVQFYFLPEREGVMEFSLHNFPEDGYITTCYAVKENQTNQKSFILSEPDEEPNLYSVMPAFCNPKVKKMDGTLTCITTKEGDFDRLRLQVNVLMNDEVASWMRRTVLIERDPDVKRKVNRWLY